MKKTFLSTFYLILCIIAGTFMQSCASEDSMDELTSHNSFTPQEKVHIMKLAEEYGLNITLDKEIIGKKPTMEEIELEFQAFASLKGEYEFVKLDDNTVVSRKKESIPWLKSASESGSWTGTRYANQISITMTVSWDLTNYPYSHNPVTMNGEISNGGIPMESRTTDQLSRYFNDPEIIEFSCTVSPASSRGYTVRFYVSGYVKPDMGIGDFNALAG